MEVRAPGLHSEARALALWWLAFPCVKDNILGGYLFSVCDS